MRLFRIIVELDRQPSKLCRHGIGIGEGVESALHQELRSLFKSCRDSNLIGSVAAFFVRVSFAHILFLSPARMAASMGLIQSAWFFRHFGAPIV